MSEFVIHELAVGGGVLAISPMPGRTRHYGTDWVRLVEWAPQMVLTMTERHELARKGAGALPDDLGTIGCAWGHFPISDFGVPTPRQMAQWAAIQSDILAVLAKGGRVLVHCYGGCGRSGMAVLRLMIAAGVGREAALARLRAVRPCAVETQAQMDWAMSR